MGKRVSVSCDIFMLFLFEACSFKSYGDDCKLPCGFCKDGNTCNHINGSCADGCEDGWIGEKCDDGKYIEKFFPYMKFLFCWTDQSYFYLLQIIKLTVDLLTFTIFDNQTVITFHKDIRWTKIRYLYIRIIMFVK